MYVPVAHNCRPLMSVPATGQESDKLQEARLTRDQGAANLVGRDVFHRRRRQSRRPRAVITIAGAVDGTQNDEDATKPGRECDASEFWSSLKSPDTTLAAETPPLPTVSPVALLNVTVCVVLLIVPPSRFPERVRARLLASSSRPHPGRDGPRGGEALYEPRHHHVLQLQLH